jgi:hypothetical protein
MSLESDPRERIPSNFWTELYPILELTEEHTPVIAQLGRDDVTDRFVEKYRTGKIKNIIHLRRIAEAFDVADDPDSLQAVSQRLREYNLEEHLETRAAFDGFIGDNRRFQTALNAADKFLRDVTRAKLDHSQEGKNELISKLTEVLNYVQGLLEKLQWAEEPPPEDDADLTD